MKIDAGKCIGCKRCYPYCTMGAIGLVRQKDQKYSVINQDECVECGACLRSEICPQNAIFMPELTWPRIVRAQFGNPYYGHPSAGQNLAPPPEMKINDITGRIECGATDFVVEMGRPGVSTSFNDVQTLCTALAGIEVRVEHGGPVAAIMEDLETGKLKEDVLNERALNVMIHFRVDNRRLGEIFALLKQAATQIDTVFSLSLVNRVEKDGSTPAVAAALVAGFTVAEHGKTNLGLGRKMGATQR